MFGQAPAFIALAVFPIFALILCSKLDRVRGLGACVLCGSLFLPVGISIDFPGIPPLDKEYVTYLSALLGSFFFYRRSLSDSKPFRGPEVIIVLMLLGNVGTMLLNPNPLWDEGKLEPGLGWYWLLAQTTDDLVLFCIPFLVGRAMIKDMSDLVPLFRLFVAMGVWYLYLILVEVLMSIPFRVWYLNQVIYGISFQPSWRWGVIQPRVFLQNGLALATFMAIPLIMATALIQAGSKRGESPRRRVQLMIAAGLVMTRNLTGNIMGFSWAVLLSVVRPRKAALITFLISIFVVSYPLLRTNELLQVEWVVDFAASIEPERARSFGGRFEEEEFVFSQLGDRLMWGWGNIDRTPGATTYSSGERGIDPFWVIELGAGGLFGVYVIYLLMAYPIYLGWRRIRKTKSEGTVLLITALMAIITLRMGDLLLNGWWNSMPVFLAGVLYGAVRAKESHQH